MSYFNSIRELAFALLLVSGPLKAHIILLSLPIPNLTLVSLLLCIFILLFDVLKSRLQLSLDKDAKVFLIALFAFVLWLTITSQWSASPEFWAKKIGLFMLPFFACIYPFLLPKFDVQTFFRRFFEVSFVTCLLFLYFYPRIRLGLMADSGMDLQSYKPVYLGVGWIAAVNILLVVAVRNNSVLFKLFKLAFFAGTLFLTSARGATLFCAIVIMGWAVIKTALFVYGMQIHRRVLAMLLVSFLSIVAIIPQGIALSGDAIKVVELSLSRFERLINASESSNESVRVNHILFVSDKIEKNPIFGNGLGSYGKLKTGLDEQHYPHNIFLEVWFEMGIIGLLIYVFILSAAVIKGILSKQWGVLVCVIYLILNTLTAGSYSENRFLFAFMGLAFVAPIAMVGREPATKVKENVLSKVQPA